MAESIRWPLAAIAAAGLLLGVMPLLWMLKRVGRSLIGRPPPAVGGSRYAMAFMTSVLLVGVGIAALGLAFAMQTWHSFTKKTHIAEVQCIELASGKLRIYYVGTERDGTRGPTEIYDVDGDEWTVGGDILRLRPFLTLVGLETVFNVSRVEGRWVKAADANAHRGTAFDRGGGTGPGWLQLYRGGTKGPLGWMIAGARGQAVSQLPDRRAVYDLYVTPNGFIVDKRTL